MKGDINIYCDVSSHLPNDGHPYIVLGAVVCPLVRTKEIAHRLVELRMKHGLPQDFEIAWNKVSIGKVEFYLDVIDYFFDDTNIEFRSVIVTKEKIERGSDSQDYADWYISMMLYLIRNAISSTGNSYIYLDKRDTRSGIEVDKMYSGLADGPYDFDRRKIRRVQVIESHHVGHIQLADLLVGAVNYANRGLNTNTAKVQVIERIRERAGIHLTRSTVLSETKFNLVSMQLQGQGS